MQATADLLGAFFYPLQYTPGWRVFLLVVGNLGLYGLLAGLAHRFRPTEFRQCRTEVLYSVASLSLYTVIGALMYCAREANYTRIYDRVSTYGWPYLFLSFAAIVVLHDTYFYWTHRLLHSHPRLYRFHAAHHRLHTPTPWSAFAFHPVEALIGVGFWGFLFVIPVYKGVVVAYVLWITATSVYDHLGYRPLTRRSRWVTTAYHAQHHRQPRGNYTLYFTFWDRWMGTEGRSSTNGPTP